MLKMQLRRRQKLTWHDMTRWPKQLDIFCVRSSVNSFDHFSQPNEFVFQINLKSLTRDNQLTFNDDAKLLIESWLPINLPFLSAFFLTNSQLALHYSIEHSFFTILTLDRIVLVNVYKYFACMYWYTLTFHI